MLLVEEDGPILRLTLNRPEVKNALDDTLIDELSRVFEGLADSVRAVVLTAVGDTFCAGGDLGWMRRAACYSEEENYRDALKLANLFQTIATCRPAVVVKVNGNVFGGGCGLVAAADYAICVPGARFSFSEIKLGLVPATISPVVIQKIGAGYARALFTTGKVFDVGFALGIGLVHELADPEILEDRARAVLKSVLAGGPDAVAASKRLSVNEVLETSEAARLLARVRATPEAREGLSAFLEKRKASFVVDP